MHLFNVAELVGDRKGIDIKSKSSLQIQYFSEVSKKRLKTVGIKGREVHLTQVTFLKSTLRAEFVIV